MDEEESIKVSPSPKQSFSVSPEIWLGSGSLIAVWYISCYLFYLGYYAYYGIPFLYFYFDLNKVVTPSFILLLFVFSPVEIKPDQVKEITKQMIEDNGKTKGTEIETVNNKEIYVQKIKLGILYR
ncbi:hypothetical protein MK805_00200 [Shimazuella sp. AN120528]|uniref:hypothetical protein n=1 Tax=Shimazuella soli TaxID=1892854 RepID=UPI001F0EA59E|nr:hypothetical protein [Shimazuella soli]MCH5583402.1 hypothetical protein [Shimazuella soli]